MPRNRILLVAPSGIVVQSARTLRAVASATASLTKSKEIVITAAGTYRIELALAMSAGGTGTEAQVFRNGVAHGSLHLAAGGATRTLFVDILGGWAKGDLCQVYAKGGGGGDGKLDDFAILGSWNQSEIPVPAGKVTVDTAV